MYRQSEDQRDTDISPRFPFGRKLGLCDVLTSGKQFGSSFPRNTPKSFRLAHFFSGLRPLQHDIFPKLWYVQTVNSTISLSKIEISLRGTAVLANMILMALRRGHVCGCRKGLGKALPVSMTPHTRPLCWVIDEQITPSSTPDIF
jgi:hypothetical protein